MMKISRTELEFARPRVMMALDDRLRLHRPPITAVELALQACLAGSREMKRRKVRAVIEVLRDAGTRVCASAAGYWLARDGAEWADYLVHTRAGLAFRFSDVRRAETAAREAVTRQGRLFEDGPKQETDRASLAWCG